MKIDAKTFFDGWRGEFGPITQPEVNGLNAILAEMERWDDPRWMAYALATAFHETGGLMMPIKETVAPSHVDKNPSDAEVKDRLEKSWKAGKLPWVKTPYWREGWFGRGFVMPTHKENYEKIGEAIGEDLISNPSRALDPVVSAMIMCVGMEKGIFTGKSLPDYFDEDTDDPRNARRIVNGTDKADLIADYYRRILPFMRAATGSAPMKPPEDPRIAKLEARLAKLEAWAVTVSKHLRGAKK